MQTTTLDPTSKIFSHKCTPIKFHDLYIDAKFIERKTFHEAIKNAHTGFLKKHGLQNASSILDDISFNKLDNQLLEKVKRLFILLYINEKKFSLNNAINETSKLNINIKEWFSSDKLSIENNICKLALSCNIYPPENSSTFFHKYLKEISADASLLKNEKSYQSEIAKFKDLFGELTKEFEVNIETSDAYRESIERIIKTLRSALKTTLYSIKRTDEHDLLTQYLHTLSIAGYHDTLVSKNFESFGKNVLEKTQISKDLPLVEKIEQTWNKMHKAGIPIDTLGSMENFTLEELGKLIEEYSLYGLARFTKQGSVEPLDERKFPDNIPGSLYEEECEFTFNEKMEKCWSRAVYTCNPTVGFLAAPEFRAVLQGMENRCFTQLANDPYPISACFYTNLQNLANPNENPHAIALMSLSEEFPLSFSGISVTRDSPFYVKPSNIFDDKYREAFLRELLHKDNFSLVNRGRKNKGGLYYFPEKDRARWEEAIPGIVSSAYETIHENRQEHSPQDLSRAFKELVHIGIMRFHQQISLETLKGISDRIDFKFFDIRVCKSGIDRGGGYTIAEIYALSNQDQDHLIIGGFHARPLLVARRLMMKKYRINYFLGCACA